MLRDLILKNRSYRRFHQEVAIGMDVLRDLVDLARLSASARNAQPLKYILACEPEKNAAIFKTLAWAGYLKSWGGPIEGERPSAYIVVLGDTDISPTFGCDHGIAVQSMLLGAAERGLGGCIIGSVQRPALKELLQIPAKYEVLVVLALGQPKEQVVLEAVGADGDIKYWRDEVQVHHVPKRSLDEIIIG
jgi:nitroreductase